MSCKAFRILILLTFSISVSSIAQVNEKLEQLKKTYFEGVELEESGRPASEYYDKYHNALNIYKSLPDTLDLAWQMSYFLNLKIGVGLHGLRNNTEAEKYFLRALEIVSKNAPDAQGSSFYCDIYHYLARNYSKLSKTAWAVVYYKKLDNCHNSGMKCDGHFGLTQYYLSSNQYDKAQREINDVKKDLIALEESVGDKRNKRLLGQYFLYFNYRLEHAEATKNKVEARKYYNKLDSFYSANKKFFSDDQRCNILISLVNYLIVNESENKYSGAVQSHFKKVEKTNSYIYSNYAILIFNDYLNRGKLDSAELFLIDKFDRNNDQELTLEDWKLHPEKSLFTFAVEKLLIQEKHRISSNYKPSPLDSTLRLFNTYMSINEEYMRNTNTSISRLNYLDFSLKPFSAIKEVLYFHHKENQEKFSVVDFWKYNEKLRSYVFDFLIGIKHSSSRRKLSKNEKSKFQELRNKLSVIQDSLYEVSDIQKKSALQFKLVRYKKSIDSLLQVFSKSDSTNHSFFPTISTIKNDNQRLNTSTIQYSVSDSSLFTFVFPQDTMILKRTIISRDSLKTLLKNYKKMVEYYDYNNLTKNEYLTKVREFNNLSHQLYDILLKPSEPFIDKRVKIIPDPMFTGISFDALCTEEDKSATSFANLNYAIEKYCFHFKTIKSDKQLYDTGKKRALLSIMPDYNSNPGYRYLGSVEKEYRYLKEKTNADIWMTDRATPNYLKNNWQKYSVINFTGHASAPKDFFLSPYLSVNEDSIGLNKITSDDIQYDNINADLIILNACQTQDGIQHHTEGMLGLHKAFYLANCQSIISTMWPVTDKESSEVIRALFHNLEEGKPTDKALRAAKLDILKNKNPILSAPYFWASHNLNGEPTKVKGIFSSYNSYIYIITPLGIFLIIGLFIWRWYNTSNA